MDILTAILINLCAAFVGYVLALSWNKIKKFKENKLSEKIFGLSHNDKCRIITGSYYDLPNASSKRDVAALVEAASIANKMGADIIYEDSETDNLNVGDITEFCIGGPDSNSRTMVHISNYLKGIRAFSSKDEGKRLFITTNTNEYSYRQSDKEHALLAKIYAKKDSKPLFIICGQTSQSNRAALYYLRNNYRMLFEKFGVKQFYIILKLVSPTTYGYSMVELMEEGSLYD